MFSFYSKNYSHSLLLRLSWLVILVLIPLLSINGRGLQYWVAETIGYTVAAWVIGLCMLLLVSSYLASLKVRGISIPYIHLLWFIAIFLIAPLFLDRVEERLHFLTFGLFGALSMLMFKPSIAITFCLLLSGADELLQFYLPDRVGDLRDVAMNALASMSSGLFVWLSLLQPVDLPFTNNSQ